MAAVGALVALLVAGCAGAVGTAAAPSPVVRSTAAPAAATTTLAAAASTTAGRAVPVPADLRPSLRNAKLELPDIYHNGCHVGKGKTHIPPCVYGNPRGRITIVLLGDSHAAQWFPALQRLADRRRYRLVSLTHSHCAAPIVHVYSGKFMPSCDIWRTAALRRIARERPDLVVVATHRGYALSDAQGKQITDPATVAALWRTGYDRLMAKLHASARKIALVTDSAMVTDVPQCLARHRADARACAVPRAVSIEPAYAALERSIAAADGASLVETTKWTCSGDPCMPIKGKILIWRDSHHITVVMAKSTAPKWATAVRSILNG